VRAACKEAASAFLRTAPARGTLACVDAAPDLSRAYLDALEPSVPAAAKALRRFGNVSRGGAAEALAAAGALLPPALGRHQRKRATVPNAAGEVIAKFGRTAALLDPTTVLQERLADPETNPRLGGLLGDDGVRAALWLAPRTGDDAGALGRALAACAPLVLAALGRAGPVEALRGWLAALDVEVLADPARLTASDGAPARTFRALRSRAFPWWTRVLP
jgi:hypothetical protein